METQRLRFAPPPQSIFDELMAEEVVRFPMQAGELVTTSFEKNRFVLLGVQCGTITLSLEDTTFLCHADQCVLLLPEAAAVLHATEAAVVDSLSLYGRLAEKLLCETAQGGLFFPRAAALCETVSAFLLSADAGRLPSGKEAAGAAFSLLMQLYGESTPVAQSAYPALVSEAIGIMRNEFSYLYGIEELADRLHVTKNHLIRVFTAAVGLSPGKYLTNLRVQYAKLLLRSGEASLEAVAAAAGFSGADYFGKVFRRETGFTPLGYARAHPALPPVATDALYV